MEKKFFYNNFTQKKKKIIYYIYFSNILFKAKIKLNFKKKMNNN